MSHLQTYIFNKPNNQIISTQRRRRRQNSQAAAWELGVSPANYQDFEAGRCGLPLDHFERLELTPFQERLCLRASCRRGRSGSRPLCPRLDKSLGQSLEISEHISRKTRRGLSPASPLVKLANRYQSDDDFADRIRQKLLRQPPENCQSDQEFYNQLADSLAEHQIHVLAHPLGRNWLGYSLSPGQSMIVVNRSLPVADQTYSLIAQLGDLLSSNATSRPVSFDKVDRLINSFAAHFIVPLKDLRRQLNGDRIQLDRFYRHFRGGNGDTIRQQLERLRPEFGQSRRFGRLVSLLTVKPRERLTGDDDSTAKKLIDFNGRVYLAELAAVSNRNWSVKALPKGLFGYQSDHPADRQTAAHLLNSLKTPRSRRGLARI